MRLRSYNWLYLLSSLPLIAADAVLFIVLASGRIWITALIGLITAYLYVILIRKFSEMPHRIKEYGNAVLWKPSLPIQVDADFYLSDEMARYSFMGRTVEIVTSLRQKGKACVMVNPAIQDKGGRFAEIAIVREVLKNVHAVNIKNFAGISSIVLASAGLLASYFIFRPRLAAYFSPFFLDFGLPFAIAFAFVALVFLWNRGVSRRDEILDRMLLEHYTVHEVEDYIALMDSIEGEGESDKARTMNDYFSRERIRKLNKPKGK